MDLAFQRLITNPENTYKNYFRQTYNNYAYALDSNISVLSKKIKAGFLPNPALQVFMPKSNGLSRMYTLLSIEDQIVCQAFGNIIADSLTSGRTVRKRYKQSVFGNLYTESDSIYFYQDWKQSYSAFSKAISKSHMLGNDYIGSFDLTACYDSINHNTLSKALNRRCDIDEACIDALIRLIESWMANSIKEIGIGIPQGPQTSGIISEVVLSEYDEYIEELKKLHEFDYYRYVDDIKVLAKDEVTVKWILFLLDKKSKEMGLFPQSSKISIHKINKIEDEIKTISVPLFEDEYDEGTMSIVATKKIKKLIKEEPADLTTIRRYFRFVKQNSESNKLAIRTVEQFPNLIDAFSYYVKRYPRTIPPTIVEYIYSCCNNRASQYASGLLLEAAAGNISKRDIPRFASLARELINQDKKNEFIIDCRFKAQLISLLLSDENKTNIRTLNYLKKSNWWIKTSVLLSAEEREYTRSLSKAFYDTCIGAEECDLSLASAKSILSKSGDYTLPKIRTIAPVAQNMLVEGKVIRRKRYSSSQINKLVPSTKYCALNRLGVAYFVDKKIEPIGSESPL